MFEILKNNKKLLAVHIGLSFVLVLLAVVIAQMHNCVFPLNKLGNINNHAAESTGVNGNWKLVLGSEPDVNSTSTEIIPRGYVGNATIKIWKIIDINSDGCSNTKTCSALFIDQRDINKLPASIARDYTRSNLAFALDFVFFPNNSDDAIAGQGLYSRIRYGFGVFGEKQPSLNEPLVVNLKSVRIFGGIIYLSTTDELYNENNWVLVQGNPMDLCSSNNYGVVSYKNNTSTIIGGKLKIESVWCGEDGGECGSRYIFDYNSYTHYSLNSIPYNISAQYYNDQSGTVELIPEFDQETTSRLQKMSLSSMEAQLDIREIEYSCDEPPRVKVKKIITDQNEFIKMPERH